MPAAATRPHFRTAFVSGASSGLGQAIALELARRGTRARLAARRLDRLVELAQQIRVQGGQAEAVRLDVLEPRAVIDALRALDQRAGGLDLVLANAGVGGSRSAREVAWEALEETLRVNALGAMATLWAGLGPMLARGHGTLAGMSSVAGMRGLPTSGAYSASKAALTTFLETLAVDLAGSGVRVVDLRPGFVRTPMTAENRFAMPFLLEVDDAARRAVGALERGQAVAIFPRRMALLMRLAERLPDGWYRAWARRFSPQR
jgi:short-subunit dehydrogenase